MHTNVITPPPFFFGGGGRAISRKAYILFLFRGIFSLQSRIKEFSLNCFITTTWFVDHRVRK